MDTKRIIKEWEWAMEQWKTCQKLYGGSRPTFRALREGLITIAEYYKAKTILGYD